MEMKKVKVIDVDDSKISIDNLPNPTDFNKDTTLIARREGNFYILTSGFCRFQVLKDLGHEEINVLIEEEK